MINIVERKGEIGSKKEKGVNARAILHFNAPPLGARTSQAYVIIIIIIIIINLCYYYYYYEEVDFPKSDTYALTITAQTFDIT